MSSRAAIFDPQSSASMAVGMRTLLVMPPQQVLAVVVPVRSPDDRIVRHHAIFDPRSSILVVDLRHQSFLRMPFHRSQALSRAHLLASFRLAGSSPARINPCPAPS
jgi:hypothetical protein